MQINQLQRKTPQKSQKRVGRGGGRGKTSGRGTKGQKARAGHKMMPAIREILKKLPKRRGYSQKSIETKPRAVNVGSLEKFFSAGDAVNAQTLAERGLVRSVAAGRVVVKILGDGELSKKLIVSGCKVSASAKQKIEAAGGSVAH